MRFSDINKDINGHLEIWKHYPDGSKELHWEDKNVICSGMGATLAEMFDAEPTVDIENYQILYFKVGVSGSDQATSIADSLQVSTTGDVSAGLNADQYGDGNLSVSYHDLIRNGEKDASKSYFGVIPYSFIKRVTDTKCMWQIVLDEQTANVAETPFGPGSAEALNEIGLYSKNPYLEATDASMLCAYRYFKPVYKSDAFILVFRWTIEF
jgi:hypothetical protein|tara:strand:- start:30 stop:659 length:630 start_codon:yes stop_codon:yes gene_type:complete